MSIVVGTRGWEVIGGPLSIQNIAGTIFLSPLFGIPAVTLSLLIVVRKKAGFDFLYVGLALTAFTGAMWSLISLGVGSGGKFCMIGCMYINGAIRTASLTEGILMFAIVCVSLLGVILMSLEDRSPVAQD